MQFGHSIFQFKSKLSTLSTVRHAYIRTRIYMHTPFCLLSWKIARKKNYIQLSASIINSVREKKDKKEYNICVINTNAPVCDWVSEWLCVMLYLFKSQRHITPAWSIEEQCRKSPKNFRIVHMMQLHHSLSIILLFISLNPIPNLNISNATSNLLPFRLSSSFRALE